MPLNTIKQIAAYRELLIALTYRDIQVKYKQAVMGVAWAFFMPALAITSGILFRLVMSWHRSESLPVAADIVGVMVKSVPWLAFAAIVGAASTSLIGNVELITKIYFPREVVPLSATLSALFDFAISLTGLVVVLAILVLVGGDKSPIVISIQLLWVPVLLAILILMAAGLGIGLSAANLIFRDVKYIVQVVLQFGILFSLVYFTYTEVHADYGWLMLFNPIAPPLEALRMVLLEGYIDPLLHKFLAYSGVVTAVVIVFGHALFTKAESMFAEYA